MPECLSIGPARPKHPTVKNENEHKERISEDRLPERKLSVLGTHGSDSNEGMKTKRGPQQGKDR
jgi:hypothetical protein